MHTSSVVMATLFVSALLLPQTNSQSAKDIRGPSPLVVIENKPVPKLIVDPPLPEPLSAERVFIQYRTEKLRVVPVFGKGALGVSPRIGHIHITVDDLPWHFVDACGETIILVGLPLGSHKVPIELADPTHRLSELREDGHALVLRMRAVHTLCDDAGDVATASFLESWIDQSQRRGWFLFESTRS